ncbi:MAG: VOC family protein [Clostridia bacterium]|nr:VOC family protein [Clostridia bacterium]
MLLHVDIFVDSMEKMLKFYVDLLGMQVIDDAVLKGDLVRFVSKNKYDAYRVVLLQVSKMGSMVELIEYLGDSSCSLKKAKEPVTITILVSSIELKIKQLQNYGIYPVSDVFQVELPRVGKSRIVFYEDPEGNMIEFLQMG